MPNISLDYTLTDASGGNKSGQLTAQVDYVDAGYESTNLSKLLDQIFIYQNSEDSFTVKHINFNKDFILGVFDATRSNYQGFGSSDGVAAAAETSLTNFITDNALTGISVAVNSGAATIVFTKNLTNTGTNDLPLDYFDILSQFASNNDSMLDLKGYSKAVFDNDTITFKAASYIDMTKPVINASYISLD